MRTVIAKRYSPEMCKLNFKSLFVFGDNLERVGMGGQAIIREQKNAIGIATKAKPSMDKEAFFTDKEYNANCLVIDEDIQRIKDYAKEIEAVEYVFPEFGIGTGLAAMTRYCPRTFCYLTERLLEEFQFNNIEFLKPA